MSAPLPWPGWELVGTASLTTLAGRSLLTFWLGGSTYRKVVVWGDPPSDRVVTAAGNLMVEENEARPHGVPDRLTNEPPPPEPDSPDAAAERFLRVAMGLEQGP